MELQIDSRRSRKQESELEGQACTEYQDSGGISQGFELRVSRQYYARNAERERDGQPGQSGGMQSAIAYLQGIAQRDAGPSK